MTRALTAGQVAWIRRRYARGQGTYAQLAATYGVGAQQIGRIVRRQACPRLPAALEPVERNHAQLPGIEETSV